MKKFAILIALVLLGLLCAGLHDGDYGAGKAQAASSVVLKRVNEGGGTTAGYPHIGSSCGAAIDGAVGWCWSGGKLVPCMCSMVNQCGIYVWVWHFL